MTAVAPIRHPASIEAQQAQAHGYHVFNVSISINPVDGKKIAQYPPSWRTASTTDPAILRWIDQAQGFGIDCGASGIVGVDLDRRPDGVTLWRDRGYPVSPLRFATQGGGMHMLFRADPAHPLTIASYGKLGVDVRGAEGLLYGPGTEVAGGGRYERVTPWLPPGELPPVPWALLEQLAAENLQLKRAAAEASRPGILGPVGGDQVAQCQAYVDQHMALLEQSMDGGFNDALNQYCFWVGRLFATVAATGRPGDFSLEAAEQYVIDALAASPVTDAADANDLKTIRRSTGLRGGLRAPFTAPVAPKTAEDIWQAPKSPAAGAEGAPGQPAAEGDTWTPVDVGAFLDGTYEPPKATAFTRSDGQALLYPERVNWIQGESESGKSWCGQYATAQELLAEHDAAYVDFESNPGEVIHRLVLLGVPPALIRRHLTYINPTGSARHSDGFAALLTRRLAIVVVDGVTDALGTEGLSMMDNDQVATWVRNVLRPLGQHTGAAVVCIDHVTKSKDERGRFAIGAQSKLAGLSGAAYVAEVRQQLGIGLTGVVELRVAKDRPGTVRPLSVDYRESDRTASTALLTFDSTTPGKVRVTVAPAVEQRGPVVVDGVELPWDPLDPPIIGGVLEDVEGYQLASGGKFLGRDAVRPLAQFMAASAGSGAGRSRAEAVKFFAAAGMLGRTAVESAWDRLLEASAIKPEGSGSKTGRHLWMGAVDHAPESWIKA